MSTPRKTQALSLLENILEETQSEAEKERQRLEEELRRKEEETKRVAEEAERQRRLEIARRLEEEEARRSAAVERRTAAINLMKMEELREQGLLPETEPEPAPRVEAARSAVDTSAATAARPSVGQSRGVFAAAAAALVLVAAGGGAWAWMNQEFVDAKSFAKQSVDVVALADSATTVAFARIPDPIVVAAPAAAAAPRRSSGGSSSSSATPARTSIRGSLGNRIGRQ